jgi:hypothetical protein
VDSDFEERALQAEVVMHSEASGYSATLL